MGSIFSIADAIDMVRRRIVTILAVFLIGSIIGFFYALSKPHLYTSSEVLQVQSPTIAADLAPTTIGGSSARRLQLIEQQVMSRGGVMELIEKLGLFTDAQGMSDSEKVALIRQAVKLEGVAAAREGYSDDGTVSLLRITANWPTAAGAQKIAHEFSLRTIALSISTRLEQARETLGFFELQEQAVRAEIATLEADITQFRTENDIVPPGNLEVTQREVESLTEAMLNIDRRMLAVQRRLDTPANSRIEKRQREADLLERQGLEAERALLARTLEALNESLVGTPELDLQLAEYDRQLGELRAQLQQVSARRKEAQVGFQLETQRQSERLTVLEPAPLPDYPFTRARKQIVVLGAAASLLLGIGLAFLLDLRHPVIRSAAQMERDIGLRPVISIPEMKPVRRRKLSSGWLRRALTPKHR
ncbi:DUF874 domain-containing protein [Pseudohalocynthiibacter aestuariivivens]|uniref:DUF874 domain-containing protein n=1 Tax=Roseovarius pelagicus TaxID=2980108 RepID=A0ABY6DBJ2_9RHOB|nr:MULTISPECIES: DUF874 domain-containing protein [Rhodobacterales]QIE44574.1 DUF874 domain-containing protein [Pseudohalocynthiibacter aestuariivivens]UXX83522.1 DUF874 domain-containing protein [Roseovarius pelagicus]